MGLGLGMIWAGEENESSLRRSDRRATRTTTAGAAAETPRQPCGAADGGAGRGTGPGFPCPDPPRRAAREGWQLARVGDQRGAASGGGPLLLQVRRAWPP